MTIFDPNAAFIALHEKLRKGEISQQAYNAKLSTLLILNGKVAAKSPYHSSLDLEPVEHSGPISYAWDQRNGMTVSLREPWDGQHRLNQYPRHVRQAARVGLDGDMTDVEASKLHAARCAGDAAFEAVMDDLLCARAEEISQKQGPDTKRAVNIDERFHLADNPDVIPEEELETLIVGTGRRALADMER